MKSKSIFTVVNLALGLVMLQYGCGTIRPTADAASMDADANAALQRLYAESPVAVDLASKAKAILVFPEVLKAGFLIGGQRGNGVLLMGGRSVGYYNTTAVSYGLQAGAQRYGYAMFLMDDAALAYLHKSDGWEIGVGPSVVVVDKGKAKSLTTTTLQKDVYAFIFNQSGLMAGLGIQGSKITEIKR